MRANSKTRRIALRIVTVFLLAVMVASSIVAWRYWPNDAVERQSYVAPESTTSSSTTTPRKPASKAVGRPVLVDPKPGDVPVSVKVIRGNQTIVARATIGPATSRVPLGNGRYKWSPVPGTTEWYQPKDHPRPGEMSRKYAIIAGHVWYGGHDVFTDLYKVKKGDIIAIAYDSGSSYKFKVNTVFTEDKNDLAKAGVVWDEMPKLRQRLALVTCDAGNGFRPSGERRDNRVVLATRIK